MSMFREFETTCMDEWPDGMRFVCGFGKAMTTAMQEYIEENKDMLIQQPATRRSVAG